MNTKVNNKNNRQNPRPSATLTVSTLASIMVQIDELEILSRNTRSIQQKQTFENQLDSLYEILESVATK